MNDALKAMQNSSSQPKLVELHLLDAFFVVQLAYI